MAYSEEKKESIFNSIIEKIVEGQSVNSILNGGGLTNYTTLMDWIDKDEEKAKRYAHAKEESADSDADRISLIAEGVLDGTYDASSARVAIDAYKWTAGKKKPKKYGEKLDLTTNGKDVSTAPLTPLELIKQLKEIDESL